MNNVGRCMTDSLGHWGINRLTVPSLFPSSRFLFPQRDE